ncbi:MAG: DUF5683 domain-containing protein [Bacteroidales bacterium]|jgi:hypothetical protein|nr:DUF5683 domain-containing protein [Bacteroidales bacterium]
MLSYISNKLDCFVPRNDAKGFVITRNKTISLFNKSISLIITTCICLLISINTAFAQTTSVDEKQHSPTRATIYSAVLPGLGQAYNKNYWKIPIIYAGFGGIGYGLYFYQRQYMEFRDVYNTYKDNPPEGTFSVLGTSGYTISTVQSARDYYRRYRDLCIIGASAWYLLNILEAYVYANLFDFDVSDDLSWRISPTLIPTTNARLSPGLNISFSF